MNKATYEGFFKNLGRKTRTRFQIINLLEEKPKSVKEITEELGIEQSAVSHHLGKLKQCKLIKSKKDGKKRIYSLSETVKPALKAAEEHKNQCCLENCPYRKKRG